MVKFSFEYKILVIPMFISPCLASSGKDMAVFIFDDLREKEARFEKLVSLATDGATNMVGKYSGMTTIINELIMRHCRETNVEPTTVNSVWCFAHRLNLATRAFLKTKPANVVLVFADWFSNRRNQVSNRQFW